MVDYKKNSGGEPPFLTLRLSVLRHQLVDWETFNVQIRQPGQGDLQVRKAGSLPPQVREGRWWKWLETEIRGCLFCRDA